MSFALVIVLIDFRFICANGEICCGMVSWSSHVRKVWQIGIYFCDCLCFIFLWNVLWLRFVNTRRKSLLRSERIRLRHITRCCCWDSIFGICWILTRFTRSDMRRNRSGKVLFASTYSVVAVRYRIFWTFLVKYLDMPYDPVSCWGSTSFFMAWANRSISERRNVPDTYTYVDWLNNCM